MLRCLDLSQLLGCGHCLAIVPNRTDLVGQQVDRGLDVGEQLHVVVPGLVVEAYLGVQLLDHVHSYPEIVVRCKPRMHVLLGSGHGYGFEVVLGHDYVS